MMIDSVASAAAPAAVYQQYLQQQQPQLQYQQQQYEQQFLQYFSGQQQLRQRTPWFPPFYSVLGSQALKVGVFGDGYRLVAEGSNRGGGGAAGGVIGRERLGRLKAVCSQADAAVAAHLREAKQAVEDALKQC